MPVFRSVFLIAAAALFFTASTRAAAQSPIVAPTSTGLSFGQVVVGALPGSVRVSPSGFQSTSGATYARNSFGVSAASFTVACQPDASMSTVLSVMLPVSATLSSGKNEMTIDGFEYSWGPACGARGQSSRTLTVGATLHVGARQPSAEYVGSFAFTVVYN
jgi:hypothetical protein